MCVASASCAAPLHRRSFPDVLVRARGCRPGGCLWWMSWCAWGCRPGGGLGVGCSSITQNDQARRLPMHTHRCTVSVQRPCCYGVAPHRSTRPLATSSHRAGSQSPVMMVCSLARIRLMIAMAPTHDQDGDCQVRGYACNLIYNYPHGVLTEAAADGEAGEVGEVGGLETKAQTCGPVLVRGWPSLCSKPRQLVTAVVPLLKGQCLQQKCASLRTRGRQRTGARPMYGLVFVCARASVCACACVQGQAIITHAL